MRKDTRNSGFAGGMQTGELVMPGGHVKVKARTRLNFRWWAGCGGLFSSHHVQQSTLVVWNGRCIPQTRMMT